MRKFVAASGRVRRPVTLADSCHLKTADLKTLSGVMSVVLTGSRNVVYIFCKRISLLARNVFEQRRWILNFYLSDYQVLGRVGRP